MSIPWQGPKGPPTDNRGPHLLAASWTLAVVASTIVGVRLYTRIKFRGGLQSDDYLMTLSLLCSLATSILVSYEVSAGFGQHVYYLSSDQLLRILKAAFAGTSFAALASCLGRISIAVSLLILIGTNAFRRWFLWFVIAQQVGITIICNSITVFYCRPVAKFWDKTLPGKCIDPVIRKNAGYVLLSSAIFTDVVLTVMPILIISALNLKLRLKVGLVALMSIGLLNSVTAVVFIYYYHIAAVKDSTYDVLTVYCLGALQQYILPIAGSLPFLRPLFVGHDFFSFSWFRSRRSSDQYDSYSNQSPGAPKAGKSKKKDMQSLPHIPQDRFVTTTLRGAGPGMVTENTVDTNASFGSLSTLDEESTQPSRSHYAASKYSANKV